MDKILGRVVTVAGSQTTVKLDADYRDQWITARLRRCLEHSRNRDPRWTANARCIADVDDKV